MDIIKVIKELRVERDRVDRAIQVLEGMLGIQSAAAPRKRGRPKMTPEERAAVSERMRKYWAARRGRKS